MTTLSLRGWMILLLPVIVFCFSIPEVAAQTIAPNHKKLLEDQSFWNKDLRAIAQPRSNRDWIFLNTDFNDDPLTLFSKYKTAFGLHQDDEMRIREIGEDQMGIRHFKFAQYHKSIPVYHATMIVHQNVAGKIYLVNGKMKRNFHDAASVIISQETALAIALKQVPAEQGLWNYPDREQRLKEATQNADTSYFPHGTLTWCTSGASASDPDAEMHLGWKFELWVKGAESKTVIIDAVNGTVIRENDLADLCNSGSVTTPDGWYGNKTINTQFSDNKYFLIDDCDSDYELHVYDYNIDGDDITEISASNNTWTENDGHAELAGATALYGVDKARDYYAAAWGRDSWDDSNGDMIAYVNANVEFSTGSDPTNACFGCDGEVLTFGYGNDISIADDDWVTIDVVGHEYTHGVNRSEDAVQEDGEPDGLNESFADIFGEMIEDYALGSPDWENGTPFGSGRSFTDPQYDTYGTPAFNDETSEHAIGEVQNYWFYLLYNGGIDTNYYGNITNVTGIGTDAINICYQSITNYLEAESEYIDARFASIQSAIDLFGSCSDEAIQVGKAWDAVNVGPQTVSYTENVCGTVFSGSYHAIHELSAASGCTNIVSLLSSSVTYGAGKDVVFKPGFTCTGASELAFTAYIEPCDFTILEKNTDVTSNEVEAGEYFSNELSLIKIYPNPADDITTIEFALNEDLPVSVSILDVSGRTRQQLLHDAYLDDIHFQTTLNTKDFAPGLYVCVLKSGEQLFTQKFLVQH